MSATKARVPAIDPDTAQWRFSGDLCIAEFAVAAAPDLVELAAARPERYPFLLESSAGAAAQSRHDLLLAFPGEAIEADSSDSRDFFTALDTWFEQARSDAHPGLAFVGGWFVYAGYDMAAQVEPSLRLPPSDTRGLPDAMAVRCPAGILFDRSEQRMQIVAENSDQARVQMMLNDLVAARGTVPTPDALVADWQEQPPGDYIEQVETARALIQAGDVFQVNLSRVWHGRLAQPQPPAAVYRALRAANPAPFSGLVQWRDSALACSSPERLLLLDDGWAQTRPIAGTRVRTPGSDQAMTHELLTHPKERAEHVMLIDLERNDLGRVCRPGTIVVDELMVAESYAHVHHIVSNVCGQLRAGIGPGQALKAVFPGGTITGCPKVRCMEIIAELEGEGRGAYTGSFGYLSRCGRMDSNIIIRSLTQHDNHLVLRTGAGIVADSIADNELEETRIKARGVLRSFVDSEGQAYG